MKKVLFSALTLALASVAFAADHPDFTGNWKIDASRAAEGKGPSPQTTRMVTEEGNKLLRNSRKTECGASKFLIGLAVRAAPFALLRNTRKTECGAKQFLACLVVRAAPFALLSDTTIGERMIQVVVLKQ